MENIKSLIYKKFKGYVARTGKFYEIFEEPGRYFFPDTNAIRELKNKFEGKRCFIVGNGPSLNKLDLNKLSNEYSFAVNGIFYKTKEMGYKPTFYVVEDRHVMKDNLKEINAYKVGYKFFPTVYRKYITNKRNCFFFNMNRGFYENTSPNFSIPRFSTDFSKRVYCGHSVTIINLQIAYYLGFKDVYLIGMDFSYNIPATAKIKGLEIESTEDDVNHFHPEYFGKGKKWHDPQLDKVLKSYQLCKFIYECAGKNIYNATIGGNLDVFKRVDYLTLFNS